MTDAKSSTEGVNIKPKRMPKVTGKDLMALLNDFGHERSACPACAKDLKRIACVDIVYTYEICGCERAPYKHLIPVMWHRKCFKESK